MIEIADTSPDIAVQTAEYTRLLGYPRDWVLEGRALELADAAREWYARHGRPAVYAREVGALDITGQAILIDRVAFSSPRLMTTLRDAGAHGLFVVAVTAGPELEAEAQRLWQDGKPDEYFFLEVYGSALVEHLITMTGARLCAWADGQEMAVLPHYSPGYPDWDIAEQPRLLDLIRRTTTHALPFPLDAFDTGMLNPKKSLLAVFGVTRHTDRVERRSALTPCEHCSYLPCQYRRAPYRRAAVRSNPELGGIVAGTTVEADRDAGAQPLDRQATYSVNTRALQRWAAERLSLDRRRDGAIDAVFRYEGTTCTNAGRPLHFRYEVTLGPRAEGYPIRAQRCRPAEGDDGFTYMCRFVTHREPFMAQIEQDQPLRGRRLDDIIAWQRPRSAAGCYCEPDSRLHKWGLVLETIHYALAQESTS